MKLARIKKFNCLVYKSPYSISYSLSGLHPGLSSPQYSTLRRDCQSVATVGLRAVNGQVLNEPALHCMFATLLYTLTSLM